MYVPSATYIPPLYFKMITVAVVLFALSIGIAVPNGELCFNSFCHSFV